MLFFLVFFFARVACFHAGAVSSSLRVKAAQTRKRRSVAAVLAGASRLLDLVGHDNGVCLRRIFPTIQ